MPDLIIKPENTSGNKVRIQDQGAVTRLQTEDAGITLDTATVTTAFTSPGIDDNANATAITIDSDEKVGIGETSPDSLLHLKATTPELRIEGSQGSADGDVGNIVFYNGTNAIGKIRVKRGADIGDGEMEFMTANDSTGSPVYQTVLHLDQNGKVGIGTSTPSNYLTLQQTGSTWMGIVRGGVNDHAGIVLKTDGAETDGAWAISMDASEQFIISDWTPAPDQIRLTIATNGNFSGSGTSDISDGRLKENVSAITGALDTIKKLTGRTYNWKPEMYMGDDTRYGLVAQEVEPILPDLVNNSSGIRKIKKSDGSLTTDDIGEDVEYSKSIHMSGVIPILIEAVKELSAKNDDLEAKVTALENA